MKFKLAQSVMSACLCILAFLPVASVAQSADNDAVPEQVDDIALTDGFSRVSCNSESFGAWLRDLPLKPDTARIRLYDGSLKRYQDALYRVIDLDIGATDLLQCADAALRMQAEYLFANGRLDEIAFRFTSGDTASYARWIEGWRPIVNGNAVRWERRASVDSTYGNFQRYLNTIYMYCGSYSMERDLERVKDIDSVRPGDCFIQGGFPGHVIIVLDCAIDSGENRLLLLGQGYTPAQDIHVIRNPHSEGLNPWYRAGEGDRLYTPEWTFDWTELYRFLD